MLFWLLPIAIYSASDSRSWTYGPEHVFKAEVYANVSLPTEAGYAYSEIIVDFVCRPMGLVATIQCRVDSATLDKYDVLAGSSSRRAFEHHEEFGLDNVVFQVEFREMEIFRMWFLNSNSSYVNNMIRAIIGTINVGFDIDGKQLGSFVSYEKSINGVCKTSFDISKKLSSEVEEEEDDEEDDEEKARKRFKFYIPSSLDVKCDETVVIEKHRNLDECAKKTPYFFGSTDEEDASNDAKTVRIQNLITQSKSWIYLSERSFIASTENVGSLRFISGKSPTLEMQAGEMIRVSLRSIRAAKEKLRNTGSLAHVGAGYDPGTPWPERDVEPKIKFFM